MFPNCCCSWQKNGIIWDFKTTSLHLKSFNTSYDVEVKACQKVGRILPQSYVVEESYEDSYLISFACIILDSN